MSHHLNSRVPLVPACVGVALIVAASVATAQTSGSSSMTNAGTSNAGTMSTQSAAKVSSADKAFVQKAAIGGMAEVQMGQLAQQKAGSDQVKQFGSRMVDDHSKANDELKQVATSKGLTLPTDLDSKHKSKMQKLEKLSGAQFDRAYMDDMVADHKEDVSDFQKQAKSGGDADIKGFASKTLPTLQEHLSMAQSTDKAVKAAK